MRTAANCSSEWPLGEYKITPLASYDITVISTEPLADNRIYAPRTQLQSLAG